MPRDSGGAYTLPAGNPVVSGTIIASTWANTTMDDLASAMTDSLSRSGNGAMTAPLKHTNGSESNPSQTFNNDPLTGRYLAAVSDMRDTVNATDIAQYTATGVSSLIAAPTEDKNLTRKDYVDTEIADAIVIAKAGRVNLLFNPNMEIWQRGSGPFTTATAYAADRWVSSNAGTILTQITDPAKIAVGNRFGIGVTGANKVLAQGVELTGDGEAGIFQDGTTFSLRAAIWSDTADDLNVTLLFRNIAASGTNQISVASGVLSLQVGMNDLSIPLTISGVPNAGNICMALSMSNSGGTITEYVVSKIQLEEGSVSTEFEYRPIAEELALCQRYFEKSYNQEDAPSTITILGARNVVPTSTSGSNLSQRLIATKRGAPTVRFYSTDTGAGGFIYRITGGTDIATTVSTVGETGWGAVTTTLVADTLYQYHYTADAEL